MIETPPYFETQDTQLSRGMALFGSDIKNLVRVCSVCKKVMGEKEPLDDKRETHGYCDACLAKIEFPNDDGDGPVAAVRG